MTCVPTKCHTSVGRSTEVTPSLSISPQRGYLHYARSTGGPSPRFGYATPPPPPLQALRAHLVTKGQWLPAIHMVAPKAPEIFFHFPCQHSIPSRPGSGAPQRYT